LCERWIAVSEVRLANRPRRSIAGFVKAFLRYLDGPKGIDNIQQRGT
jgi:hypothetical protein